jgi:hypothetical protein
MGERTDLQDLLELLLGSENVYFQPPESLAMSYPCIVYSRNYLKSTFADNGPYAIDKCYNVTIIDKNPDSLVLDKIAALPKCKFDRHFTADNLNHDVFSLYF